MPSHLDKDWNELLSTLHDFHTIKIKRSLVPLDFGKDLEHQLFAFADASEKAIAFVVYLRTKNAKEKLNVSFIGGGTLLIPKGAYYRGPLSIPRVELCAAVECVKATRKIEEELDISLKQTAFSRIVKMYLLG